MSSAARYALVATVVAAVAGFVPSLADDAAKFKLKPGAAGKLCLECHVDFQDTIKMPSVHTPVKTGQCAGCHDPHASEHGKLLEETPDKICATCHGTMIPEGATSAHEAVAAGNCVACHDPHASPNKYNLVRAGNDLCLGCHDDVKRSLAAAQNHHAPVDRNCLGCHDPHASKSSPSLLVKSVPSLCLGCHKPDQPGFAKAHMGYSVDKSNCASCHDPHGSSNKGILWASVHEPVKNRMCAQCHGDPVPGTVPTAKRAAPDLCAGCHNKLFTEIASRNVAHWPVLSGRACANCHEPHASKSSGLLRAAPKRLCGSCHSDTIARQDRSVTKHPPIDDGECMSCHTPHASDRPFLFAGANQLEVCGTCHDWQQHSSHPLGDKAVDMRNPNLRVDCESCHRSHGTAFPHFAHADTKGDLCTQCHTQFTR